MSTRACFRDGRRRTIGVVRCPDANDVVKRLEDEFLAFLQIAIEF
jgi:hypothetical protein